MSSNELAVMISGEITLSQNPGETIKKWRDLFSISQTKLAEEVGISNSVISDYESGRRGSPGVRFIKKVVEAIIDVDRARGSHTLRAYEHMVGSINMTDAILGMIKDAYVNLFRGSMRLNLGRYGTYDVLEEAPFEDVNLDNNLSSKVFEQQRGGFGGRQRDRGYGRRRY